MAVVLSAPESGGYLATAVLNADISGADAQTYAPTDPRYALMPDGVGCLPCRGAHSSKLSDVVVADICLSLSLALCKPCTLPDPGDSPRHAHLTLKGHPVSCDANSSGIF